MKNFKHIFTFLIFIISAELTYSQCCGNGICEPGETPANCPYDCAPPSNWNCPNTIGSFFNDPNLPITYAAAQGNNYCYTIQVNPSIPSQVCFEYKKPPGGTLNVQFMISDNCTNPVPSVSNISVGSNSTSCATVASGHPAVIGFSTLGVGCNTISGSGIAVGGGGVVLQQTLSLRCV